MRGKNPINGRRLRKKRKNSRNTPWTKSLNVRGGGAVCTFAGGAGGWGGDGEPEDV